MSLHDLEGKQLLLINGGYEPLNQRIMQVVIPRIINEATAYYDSICIKPNHRPQITLLLAFYPFLLTKVNGDRRNEGSEELGACFMSYQALAKVGFTEERVRWLSNILEVNGLIRSLVVWKVGKKRKYYYPIFQPVVSHDGYVITSDGERVEAKSSELYLTESQLRKIRKKK